MKYYYCEENIDRDSLWWMACSLYDGGWRKEDREDMKEEYNLTDKEVDIVCERLEELEKENS